MISPARFREIKQIIEDCTPGEPISLDKTTAMSLLKAAGVGMMAHLELQGKIAQQEALIRRNDEEHKRAERTLNALPGGMIAELESRSKLAFQQADAMEAEAYRKLKERDKDAIPK